MLKLRLACLSLALALGAAPAHAGLGEAIGFSPFWDWRTLETEHFRITYPLELDEAARKSAAYFEEAHSALTGPLYWRPWHKTQIVVIDNSDLANGLTSSQQRLGIVLWVTPPDPTFSTTYYDDWLRLLVFHEYTHFLNMDNVRSFYEPLRYWLGDGIMPNAAWPPWMLEGFAVYMETRHTRAGRGRSPFYEMILRTSVDENTLDTGDFYTLDRFNGETPYPPAGESIYFFGYQLLNQVARKPLPSGRTADGELPLKPGPESHPSEDALGMLSYRSAGRIPYFINGNLQNVVGQDWPATWEAWVADARSRAGEQLKRIRARPLTPLRKLTPAHGVETVGATPSPDGKWLAYSSDTPDRRAGLYLLELASGRVTRVDDKLSGTQATFAGSRLIFSAVERRGLYSQWSDLHAYDVESGTLRRLTTSLRARDPDVSPDQKRIALTLTENQTTLLAWADLSADLALGEIHRIPAGHYDRVTNPRFTRDGQRIVYSLHRMGSPSEELMIYEIASGATRELVGDGYFNRYPAVGPDGLVYFVSNRTGVDNLYRVREGAKPELITNVVSGLSSPAFGPGGQLYASVYATSGWSIASLEPSATPLPADELTIAPPPAPPTEPAQPAQAVTQASGSYSVWPSILPRQWFLLPQLYTGGAYVQAQVQGYDAIDVHEYVLGMGYNTQIPAVDWLAAYSNRSLGPTISLYGTRSTTYFAFDETGVRDYDREHEYGIDVALPIRWTYSTLTPSLGIGTERLFRHYRGQAPTNDDLVSWSPSVPTADATITYSNAETSRLALGPEAGRSVRAGVRVYADSSTGQVIKKGVVRAAEYLRLFDHVTVSPSVKAAWSSDFDSSYGPANAVVQGRTPSLVPKSLASMYDPFGLRGYPRVVYYSRSAAVGALDLRVPVWRIFRGWNTHPVFLDQLYAFGFLEAAWFPSAKQVPVLPAAGGGLTLATEVLLHVPLELTVEYDQGLNATYGGKSDLFVAVKLGAIGF